MFMLDETVLYMYIFFVKKHLSQHMSLFTDFRFTPPQSLLGSSSIYPYQQQFQWKTQNVLTTAKNFTQAQLSNDKNFLEMQYLKFFQGLQNGIPSPKIQGLSKEVLQKHKIKIITNQSGRLWKKLVDQGHSYVQLASSKHNGLECQYQVIIAQFFLTVKVLNLHRNSEESINNTQYIGQGSFGVVKRLKIDNSEFALKKISFPKNKKTQFNLNYIINPEDYADCREIRRAVSQYCLYKICSMLKIGPQIYFQDFYDLICYNDGVEFHMELCQQIDSKIDTKIFQRDIKRCLNTLHSLRIIHKDVKRQNTLYSPTFKSYVLSDFGLTHSVKQDVWQKTQTYFGGSPTHASPQMKKLLFCNETGFVNLYFNDIHGLKVTLKQLENEQSFQQFSRNSMSMGEDYYEQQEEYIEENYSRQNENFLQSADEQMMTSVSYAPGSLNQSGLNYTASTCNTESQLSADRINYFQIKVIYRYLSMFPKNDKQDCKKLIQSIIEELIKDQSDYKTLKIQVFRFIIPIITNFKGELLEVTNIRNCIRMFGMDSQEVRNQLMQINLRHSIPYVNYNQLQNYLTMVSKSNKFVIKKFKNHILNMDRHICLRNKRSFVNSLRSLISNYLARKEPNEEERTEILSMGVEAMNFQGLSENESFQLVSLLWLVFDNRLVKLSQIDNECCLKLATQICQQFQRKKKLALEIIQNVLLVHIQYASLEKAKYYYKKIKDNRINLQNKLVSPDIIQNQGQMDLKISILKHAQSQVQYLFLMKYHEKALQQSKINYLRYTEFQAEDNSIKIGILENIVSILTTLKNFDQAQIYNNQLIQEISKNCFPKSNNAQFAFCFNYRGIINMSRNKFEQALKNFEDVLDCTNDSLRGPNYVKLIRQTLLNISFCYSKLKQYDLSLEFLQKSLKASMTYQCYQLQESIQTIHYIIIRLMQFNKCDRHLAGYFDQLVHLKVQALSTKRVNADFQQQKKINFFPPEIFSKDKFTIPTILFAKKTMLASVEPYLPKFQNCYVKACQQLGLYYQNQENSMIRALPYFWKIFKCLSKFDRTIIVYKQMDYYVDLLIKSNSSRRALKFLKKYAHQIPSEYQNLKAQAYKKLNALTLELNQKDRAYYDFIWKNKTTRNNQYFDQTVKLLAMTPLDPFVKKIWNKKLNLLKPQIQIQNVEQSQNLPDISTIKNIQIEQQKDATQIIAKKLLLKGAKLKIFEQQYYI